MTLVRAAHYIRQAALGLQHAFEAGLVHRDVKPGNLLLDRNGVVKVLDMGLARFFDEPEDNLSDDQEAGNVLGTADYLAPEQVQDSRVDIRADIYSLGVTFYYLLTGDSPFQKGTVAQKLIWHQVRQPRPIRSLRAEIPEDMARVIDKMLVKDPAVRYQTPAEVAEALLPWTQAPIPPPPEQEMPSLGPANPTANGGANTPISRTAHATPVSRLPFSVGPPPPLAGTTNESVLSPTGPLAPRPDNPGPATPRAPAAASKGAVKSDQPTPQPAGNTVLAQATPRPAPIAKTQATSGPAPKAITQPTARPAPKTQAANKPAPSAVIPTKPASIPRPKNETAKPPARPSAARKVSGAVESKNVKTDDAELQTYDIQWWVPMLIGGLIAGVPLLCWYLFF
jgi:serine/threonine protein kinase